MKLRDVSHEIKLLQLKITDLIEPKTLESQPNNNAIRGVVNQIEIARKLFERKIDV